MVAHGADEYPEAGAVADERGELTYGELNANANALANHLEASGVERGSVIGVIARDHRGLLTSMSAAGKAGYRLAMMNTGFGKTQFVEVAEREKIVAMLYDEEFTDLADALPAETLRIVTWVDGERPVPEGVRTLDDIVADGDTATPPEPDSSSSRAARPVCPRGHNVPSCRRSPVPSCSTASRSRSAAPW